MATPRVRLGWERIAARVRTEARASDRDREFHHAGAVWQRRFSRATLRAAAPTCEPLALRRQEREQFLSTEMMEGALAHQEVLVRRLGEVGCPLLR